MAEESIPTFIFYRTNETVEHQGVKGNRGILEANGTSYVTIERDIERFVHLPYGKYTLNMEISPTHNRQQFRIMGHRILTKKGSLAPLLVHVGNYPGQLEGCIAPGKSILFGGVDQSQIAMTELFKICGGFQVKKDAAILEVVPKFTYDWSKLKGSLMY